MTKEEAILEMRFSNVEEEDIEAIIAKCKHKNILPQFLDDELEKLGYERFFHFEYDEELGEESFLSPSSYNRKRNLE
ncbi:MAG: hypothetical protein LBS26_01590 [Campylobacteraceae bacterium]|jgi:hypothetical protein|nr:hypothetical protein [Campylobacteraceae bacterium]